MQIELINDQPSNSGAGVYAWNIFRALSEMIDVRMLYYNTAVYSSYWSKIKPLFWWDCHRRLEHRGLSHFVSQNLSFLRTKGKRIVTCLDLIPLIMPERTGERIWRRLIYSGIPSADHIIAISEHTKGDLARIYRIPSKKITVIPFGVSPAYHPLNKKACRKRLGLPDGKILLHVGSSAKRKNFTTVLKVFDQVKRREHTTSLVAVGGRPVCGERIIFRNGVPNDDMPQYYSAADALIFPSTYEGFGQPPLEAMACGCPVITSNRTSLPEVVGDAGILHDPFDVDGMAESVLRLWGDKRKYWHHVSAGLQRARKFTWEMAAIKTIGVYENVEN